MSEPRKHVRHQDPPCSIMWLQVISDAIREASLSLDVKAQIMAFVVEIRRHQLSEPTRGFYYQQIKMVLELYIKNRDLEELVASLDILVEEVKGELSFDESGYVAPTVYVDRDQPDTIRVVPEDPPSSQHQGTGGARKGDGVQKCNHHPSHADSPGDPTKDVPKEVLKKPTENTHTHPHTNGIDDTISSQAVSDPKDAGVPRPVPPTYGPIRIIRPLSSVPAEEWKISWPVFVAIDIGAWKEDYSQISSVGLNALDVARKPKRKRSSKEWVETSLPNTVYWRIAEALEGPHPAAYIPSRYCNDEVVRRADVKEKFKSYMRRFSGRNVIFTFHGAENDQKWMKELGMDPFGNYDFNPAGWLDTSILIRSYRPRGERNLEAAMEWIGHDMQHNEWHNSASDAVNINRLVARLVFELRASPR